MDQQDISILIVEDNEAYMQIAKQMLEDYKCFYAYKAIDGLDLYKKYKPDITFLDIGLPDGNGHELLMEIKNLNKNAFVVMLTGSQLKEDVISSMSQGAEDYIVKPFSRAKIKRSFDKFLNKQNN